MVIVIGGTGLVGSHLLFELAKKSQGIVATYQTDAKLEKVKKLFQFYSPEQTDIYWQKIQWKKVSVNDLDGLDQLIGEGDEVYHCAALVSFHKRDFNPLMKINREGTTNVVNVCLANKCRKLVYVSSTAAISGGAETEVTERTKWKKTPETSAYSISKYGAEREVWRGISEGLTAAIVNPCVILGAGNWSESSLTILGQIKKGLSFYPPGANAIVDARDVAKVMSILMEKEYNEDRFLLIGENVSFRELFSRIAIALHKKPPQRAVGPFGLHLARILFGLGYLFSRKRSPITEETVNSALSSVVYANDKCVNTLSYRFFTLDETIDNAIKGQIN